MFLENIKEAITSIFSNKMRSILTMLGIIIGISSVITITTIGSSIKDTLNSTLNSLGGSSIFVYLDAIYPEDEKEIATWTYPDLDDEDMISQKMIDSLISTYPNIFTGISSSISYSSGTVKKDKDTYANLDALGCTPNYFDTQKLSVLYGRQLTQLDDEKKKRVCLVADTMVTQYFGDENPIGQQILIDFQNNTSLSFTIVGVYKYNASMFGSFDNSIAEKDRPTTMFLPFNTVYDLMDIDQDGYDNFQLVVNPTSNLSEAAAIATDYFNSHYSNPDWTIETYNMSSDLEMINTVINVITLAVSAIAAISLIVGGVGVMNIMLVSVTERTKEIGIRMALGANKKTIRSQFVIESIMLCLIGGILGILIGMGNGLLLGKVAGFAIQSFYSDFSDYIILSVHPSMMAILLSLFFSMLTGVFFGFYPANKAAKMEVIDALRYE